VSQGCSGTCKLILGDAALLFWTHDVHGCMSGLHGMSVRTKNQGYQPDPSKQAQQAKLYAEWLADHEDELAERNSELERANQGKNAAYAAKHRAKRLNAIPNWADLAEIERIYIEAAATGMHVDHIYPLRGKTVCGLHVLNNLSVLSRLENLRKSNKMYSDT